MVYVTSFFQQFYPSAKHINFVDLYSIRNANAVAVDFYDTNFSQYTNTIKYVRANSNQLHIYLGEPTDCEQFVEFLNQFDLDHVHFYSDCALNFTLKHASFTPTINWFIDPINYYSTYTWARNLLAQLDYSYSKPFVIDILLGQEKPHRSYLAQLVEKSSFKHQFLYSYFKNNLSSGIMWDSQITLPNHKLTSELFQINGEDARPSALLPVDIYNQSYYSVVCETTAHNSYNQYTEKVAKPILAKRPFVAFAGQYYLKNLKSLGFKTFSSVIDESYDFEPNQQLRFNLAWQQVEQLCQLDPVTVLTELNSVLEHNQHHFLTTDWANPIKSLF